MMGTIPVSIIYSFPKISWRISPPQALNLKLSLFQQLPMNLRSNLIMSFYTPRQQEQVLIKWLTEMITRMID